MAPVSDQFRQHAGIEGDPDPALGLENAAENVPAEEVELSAADENEPPHEPPTEPGDAEVPDPASQNPGADVETEEDRLQAEEQQEADRGPVPNGYESWEEHDRVEAELRELEAAEAEPTEPATEEQAATE